MSTPIPAQLPRAPLPPHLQSSTTATQLTSSPRSVPTSDSHNSNVTSRRPTVSGKVPAKGPLGLAQTAGVGRKRNASTSLSGQYTGTPKAGQTPTPGMGTGEELMNLNMNMNIGTPTTTALMMGAGLTPLPLPGTNGMHSHDTLAMSMGTGMGMGMGMGIDGAFDTNMKTNGSVLAPGSALNHRDQPTERYNRLKEMVNKLSTHVVGRGVSVKGVENLARIHGFESILDEGVLTVARKRVELEIEFDSVDAQGIDAIADADVRASSMGHTARRVELKLHPAKGDGDPIFQRAESEVLHANLTTKRHNSVAKQVPWLDMTDFSANLAYLGKLEQAGIESKIDSFEVMDGLYESFQRIWIEEKKRLSWRNELVHACQGNVGMPERYEDGRLTVRSTWWAQGRGLYGRGAHKKAEASDKAEAETWSADFLCEGSTSGLNKVREWLPEEDILVSSSTSADLFHQVVDKPNWRDSVVGGKKIDQTGDEMDVDIVTELATGLRFTCDLQPAVLMPVYMLNDLNIKYPMVELHQHKLLNIAGKAQTNTLPFETVSSKTHHVFDRSGDHQTHDHRYNFSSVGVVPMVSISKLVFDHPQRFAEALPVLRQYALLNTLLLSLSLDNAAVQPSNPLKGGASNIPQKGVDKKAGAVTTKTPANGRTVTVRTNKSKLVSRLDELSSNIPITPVTSEKGSLIHNDNSTLPRIIDIHLDLISFSSTTKSTRIELSLPIPRGQSTTGTTNASGQGYLSTTFDIHHNGIIEVVTLSGFSDRRSDEGFEAMKRKLAKVIRATEDFGIVVEWLIQQL